MGVGTVGLDDAGVAADHFQAAVTQQVLQGKTVSPIPQNSMAKPTCRSCGTVV